MRVMWRAVCAVVLLLAATTIEIGCGNVYRPIAAPLPGTTANPAGLETEVVLSCCLNPASQNAIGPSPSGVLTDVNVGGDTNMGNKPIANVVGSVVAGTVTLSSGTPVNIPGSPMAFDYARTSVFTANTTTDTVSQVLLSSSTAGFSAGTTTISLEPGSKPISMSFQYFGATYTQDYVVNSGTATATCLGTGSLGVLTQPAAQLIATVCVGPKPVSAWIYKDQTKVFVLDSGSVVGALGSVYVVSASKYQVTNTIAVGTAPIKAAQSNDGNYIYVLNSGSGTISIIDGQGTAGQPESVVNTIPIANPLSSALPIDIAQDTNFNDTTANTQINHVWILQADGTVSVWDGTVPGHLTWITSIATITPAQVTAGVYPTNLALMRDGTGAYVGLGNTDRIVGINTRALATGAVTTNANTYITLDVIAGGVSHRNITQTINNTPMTVEATTPTVNYVAVSRGGNSSDLSKVYATSTTSTTYFYYNADGTPASPPSATYPNLYNGTAVVSAAGNGTTPINTFITTILAPSQLTYCSPATGFDGQKNCPAMTPVMVLGRS